MLRQDIPVEGSSSTTPDKLVFRIPGIRALRIPLTVPKPAAPLSSILLLVYGFGGLIILGTILLTLPISSASGQFTSPVNAIFTATSAVCVTGLVVVDTGTYWSTFGQGVLLVLFQIGGFGFLVGATLLLFAIGGRFSLRDKLFITESMGNEQLGEAVGIVIRIAVFSLVIEAAGATIFYFHWLTDEALETSLWAAIFHSVSSFNNCGMDIFGNFKSLSGFQNDAITLLTTALLIILGSTGYVVFADVVKTRSFVRLHLDTKMVLVTSGSLLIIGTLFYLIAEYSGPSTMGLLSFPQKILVAFFQSVTPRTAGFSAVDIGSLRQISLFFTMLLMFIGGTTGSMAGGVKVNTIGVLMITVLNVLRGRENVEAFGRQISRQTVYRAVSLFLLYLGIAMIAATLLSITEKFSIDGILFETFSALGTVGLSTGITPDLSIAGRIISVFIMFVGRLAPLTFMVFLVHRRQPIDMMYPHENIRLG